VQLGRPLPLIFDADGNRTLEALGRVGNRLGNLAPNNSVLRRMPHLKLTSGNRPPPLKPTATSDAIRPQGCNAPKSPQPIVSSRHVLRCETTSAGTAARVSSDAHFASASVTAVASCFASIRQRSLSAR
jgi:hypothetical protein